MSYITRHKIKGKFVYKNNTPEDLERIKKLVIPPMWLNVKIDKNKDSKVQATGYDTKGRKQYIYHKDFIEKSKSMKFNKLKTFDYNKYSRVIKHYMNKCDLSKENGSYGITTLLKKHHKNNVLTFIGKKGVAHIKYITDPRSISFIKRVMTMRGPNLFYYEPDKSITSSDLNTFLREKVQSNITCKDIRTYCANKIFVNFMNKLKKPDTEKDRKSNVIKGIDYTANELGNTRKICKDSYLCPKNINKFLN